MTQPWLRRALGARLMPLVCALVSLVLTLPALWNGLQSEDRTQRLMGWTLHMYARGTGDVFQNYAAKDLGILPWIASDDWKVAFFRPLSSLSLSADYQLWPAHPWIAHAQSLLWLSVLVAGAAALFRRVSQSPWSGGLAALLYAVDDGHGFAAGWLAARHALMASAFAVLALLCYDRWRRDAWRMGAFLAPVALLLALLSGELAVSALGFFLAHLLFLDRGALRGKLVGAAVIGAPVLIWLILYISGKYGCRGSGMYISLRDEPLAAAMELLFRVPWVWVGTLGGSADWAFWLRDSQRPAWAIAAWTLSLVFAGFLTPLFRLQPTTRFWLVGLALSAIPLSSAPPTDRLLLITGLAGMALVEEVLGALRGDARPPRAWRAGAWLLASGWLFVHGLVAPILLPFKTHLLDRLDDTLMRASRDVCEGVTGGQQLVIVQAPDYYFGSLTAGLALAQGCPSRHVRVLYGGVEPFTLERTDDTTLVLTASQGFLTSPLSRVFRGPSRPFHEGDGISLTDAEIVVLATNSRHEPTRVRARFAFDLDGPKVRFVAWRNGRYEQVQPPGLGQTITLAPLTIP